METLDEFQAQLGMPGVAAPVEELSEVDASAMILEYENPMDSHGDHQVPPEKLWGQTAPPESIGGDMDDEMGMGPPMGGGEEMDAEQMREMMYEHLSKRSADSEQYQEEAEKKGV